MKNNQTDQNLPEIVIKWYSQNKRDLPWRENKEPYHIWLSEIMLQQTRVITAIPYYKRFLLKFPTIAELAAANEDQLYKLWEGLGYYTRARNLWKAANIIMKEYGGIFPGEYEQILKLPGIGLYTAGAIASICFDKPVPAVDGNVLRVMARMKNITGDLSVSVPAMKKAVIEELARIYPKSNCGDFTQGLIELGATVCVPGDHPKCEECPVKSICNAFLNGTIHAIPLKKSSKTRKHEKITVFVLVCGEKFAIRKREKKGLLSGLWEFPNFAVRMTSKQAISAAADWNVKPEKIVKVAGKKHVFTHIEWDMLFYLIECNEQPASFLWVNGEDLRKTYTIPVAFQFPDFYFEK